MPRLLIKPLSPFVCDSLFFNSQAKEAATEGRKAPKEDTLAAFPLVQRVLFNVLGLDFWGINAARAEADRQAAEQTRVLLAERTTFVLALFSPPPEKAPLIRKNAAHSDAGRFH